MDELVLPTQARGKGAGKTDELDLGEILRLFFRHKFLLVFLVITAIITASIEHVSFPSFRVATAISVQTAQNNFAQAISQRLSSGLGGMQAESAEVPEKYFQRLNSFEFFLQVGRRLRESKQFETLSPELFVKKGLIDNLRARIRRAVFHDDPDTSLSLSDERLAAITQKWAGFGKGGTDNIAITITTPDPKLSLLLVNLIAEAATNYLTDLDLKELNDGESYLRIQLDEAEKEIRNTDAAIVDFKRSNQLLTMDMAQGDSGSLAVGLRRILEEVEITLSENTKLIERLSSTLRQQQMQAGGASLASPKFGLARKISDLERENQYLNARHETVKRVLGELLRSQNPHIEQRIFDLRKKVELQYGLYQELKKQTFQLEMERIFVKNRVRFFEKARDFNVQRSLLLSRKMLIAVVIALLIGGFGAYLWELVVPRIKNRYDLDDLNTIYLGGVPDMSRVPSVQRIYLNPPVGKRGKVDRSGPVLCRFDIDSPSAMAFKHIRTRILHLTDKSGGREQIISVHSAQIGEGKTFMAANLASCIAHLKRKVLLIDCDLRRSSASEMFKARGLTGLSEVLSAEEKFGVVVRKNVLPLLDLLPSGRSYQDATEMMASGRFSELLEDLRSVYDYNVIDTPPVILVPDSGLIAQHADMVLLLADCNTTTKENLSIAIESILQLKQKRIYSILNRIEGSRQDYVYVVPDRILESRLSRAKGPTSTPGINMGLDSGPTGSTGPLNK